MRRFRAQRIGLAVGLAVVVGCGWRGPATIVLRDGSRIRCPNVSVTKAYVSCEGMEGGERVFPIELVQRVVDPGGS